MLSKKYDRVGLSRGPASGASGDATPQRASRFQARRPMGAPMTPSLAPAHAVEEIGVALRRLDLVEQEFHRLELVHRIEEFAQDPDLLEDVRLQQQLLAPGAGAVHI